MPKVNLVQLNELDATLRTEYRFVYSYLLIFIVNFDRQSRSTKLLQRSSSKVILMKLWEAAGGIRSQRQLCISRQLCNVSVDSLDL